MGITSKLKTSGYRSDGKPLAQQCRLDVPQLHLSTGLGSKKLNQAPSQILQTNRWQTQGGS